MPVENMAIPPDGLLVDFVMITFRQRDMDAVPGGGKQGVMYRQQHVERLRGTREEEVAAHGDLPYVQFPANVDGLLPVGRKCRDIVFRHVYVVQ